MTIQIPVDHGHPDARQRSHDDVRSDISSVESVLASMEDWKADKSQSYAFQLMQALAEQRRKGEFVRDIHLRALSEFPKLDTGKLLSIRKTFGRRLTRIIVGTITTILIIKFLRKVADFALSHFANMPNWAILIFHQIVDYFTPGLYSLLWKILIGVVTFGSIAAFFGYHRDCSRFKRDVQLANFQLDAFQRADVQVAREGERMRALYPQVVEWLRLMTVAIRKPWTIEAPDIRDAGDLVRKWRMPKSFVIAQSEVQGESGRLRLEREALAELLQRGWRDEALHGLVKSVREQLGMGEDQLSLDILDADAPDSRNSTRKTFDLNMQREEILHRTGSWKREQLIPTLIQAIHQMNLPVTYSIPTYDDRGETAQASGALDGRVADQATFLNEPFGLNSASRKPIPLPRLSDEALSAEGQNNQDEILSAPSRFAFVHADLISQLQEVLGRENMFAIGKEDREGVGLTVLTEITLPTTGDSIRGIRKPDEPASRGSYSSETISETAPL